MVHLLPGGLGTEVKKEMNEGTSHSGVVIMVARGVDAAAPLLQ